MGDGTAFGKENEAFGGLLDENMEPKPTYLALDQLINHEWRTVFEEKTNENGEVKFRGFHGLYEITVNEGGKTQTTYLNLTSDKIYSRKSWVL